MGHCKMHKPLPVFIGLETLGSHTGLETPRGAEGAPKIREPLKQLNTSSGQGNKINNKQLTLQPWSRDYFHRMTTNFK